MENVSLKKEILKGLEELKQKGVEVKMHDNFLDRVQGGFGNTINGTSFVSSGLVIGGNNVEVNVKVLKKPSELSVNIYLNSTEKEIEDQIQSIKWHLETIDKTSKVSAIVEFIKEEMK